MELEYHYHGISEPVTGWESFALRYVEQYIVQMQQLFILETTHM
jgi:hypothetical protein